MYWFKRKYYQIKKILEIIPIIWGSYDFDYRYAINLFKFQLTKIADYLESEKAFTLGAKERAQKIRTAIRLMDKVYNEDYATEYIDKLKKIYGDKVLDLNIGSDKIFLEFEYEKWPNAEEVEKVKNSLFVKSCEKHQKAHKILWKFIEHNIRGWWD